MTIFQKLSWVFSFRSTQKEHATTLEKEKEPNRPLTKAIFRLLFPDQDENEQAGEEQNQNIYKTTQRYTNPLLDNSI